MLSKLEFSDDAKYYTQRSSATKNRVLILPNFHPKQALQKMMKLRDALSPYFLWLMLCVVFKLKYLCIDFLDVSYSFSAYLILNSSSESKIVKACFIFSNLPILSMFPSI